MQRKAPSPATTQADAIRKSKAGSVSGSAASASRSRPVPKTPADTQKAMLEELNSIMNGA